MVNEGKRNIQRLLFKSNIVLTSIQILQNYQTLNNRQFHNIDAKNK